MARTLVFVIAAVLVAGACERAVGASADPVPAPRPAPAAAPAPTGATAQFWAWFGKHAAELHAEKDLRHVMETISDQLDKTHPSVVAEIGSAGAERTLVLSADGDRRLFPVVQELHAARPTVAGWKIVAFRPRGGGLQVIKMNGAKLDPRKLKFVGSRDGDRLSIVVFVPGFTTLERLGPLGFLALDHLVGEYDMETKIGGIEFAALKQAPPKARPLSELPAMVDGLSTSR